MMKPTRTVISRRARPAKEPLSHELIVKTAYTLLKEEGLSGMSMRKVAKALDTGLSSLYVYVKNFQEQSAYVLDYGFGQLELPESGDRSWKERLFDALETYLWLLDEHPGLDVLRRERAGFIMSVLPVSALYHGYKESMVKGMLM